MISSESWVLNLKNQKKNYKLLSFSDKYFEFGLKTTEVKELKRIFQLLNEENYDENEIDDILEFGQTIRNMDHTRSYAHFFRETGKFGSHPSHDSFDDGSKP